MARWLTLVPAYGRDYKTPEAVLSDWKLGRDFKIMDISCRWDGSYTSCRDFGPNDGRAEYSTFKIRYGTILRTSFELPNFVLIRFVDEWKIIGKSDGTEEEDYSENALT